jgi:hypothetical protein
MFLLALFITMGTTLFSCADKNGNKKIDKIEVVKDTGSKVLSLRNPHLSRKTLNNPPIKPQIEIITVNRGN